MSRPTSLDPIDLIRPGESAPPQSVSSAHRFLTELGVWHLFSRNLTAQSCRDAAQKRYRLGHTGIAQCDEMKSFLGLYEPQTGSPKYVAIHTRGDRVLLLNAVVAVLGQGGTLRRLESEELDRLGMAYGLVNPFRKFALDFPAIQLPFVQLFDTDLIAETGWPKTVITNAGDFTWAIEFNARELFAALQTHEVSGEVRIGSFCEPEPDAPSRMGNSYTLESGEERRGRGGKITIITGNAPESGLRLAEILFDRTRFHLGNDAHGDVSMPAVDIISLPGMGMSMELDFRRQAVAAVILDAVEKAVATRTETIALACNTTQFFGAEIGARLGSHCQFVSLAETVGDFLRKQGITRVGLVGIRFVAELAEWSAYREPLTGIDVEAPAENVLEEISSLAYRVKTEGITPQGINRLRDLLRSSVECEHIILGLTELSLLIGHLRQKNRSGKTLIDPLELYGDRLARRFVWGDDI